MDSFRLVWIINCVNNPLKQRLNSFASSENGYNEYHRGCPLVAEFNQSASAQCLPSKTDCKKCLYFYFWSRVSGVITIRRPCGIEYCGCVSVCFMLILMFCSFACKIYEYEYEQAYPVQQQVTAKFHTGESTFGEKGRRFGPIGQNRFVTRFRQRTVYVA